LFSTGFFGSFFSAKKGTTIQAKGLKEGVGFKAEGKSVKQKA
jgi:hypothetical protein